MHHRSWLQTCRAAVLLLVGVLTFAAVPLAWLQPVAADQPPDFSPTDTNSAPTISSGGPYDTAKPLPLHIGAEAVPVTTEPLPVAAAAGPGDLTAPAALLMDVFTGTVLYEHNADEARPPASITKVMTMLLTYEAVARGAAAWDDEVLISERAQGMGGTQAFLAAGQTFSLADLLKAVAVASANDAAVAIAEHIGGSVEEFVAMMNDRARRLGMTTAQFRNPHGLDEADHLLSARDVAIMGRELLRSHPEVVELTSVWTYTFAVGGDCCLLTNTNRMIRKYSGVDGLKTGWTSRAAYGVIATAAQADTRLIAVVMGHPHPERRFEEAAKLLGWGFANFETIRVAGRGQEFQRIPVYEGVAQEVGLVVEQDVGVLVPRGKAEQITHEMSVRLPMVAPVKRGQTLGSLTISDGEAILATVPLVADQDIARLSLPGLWWRLWRGLLTATES